MTLVILSGITFDMTERQSASRQERYPRPLAHYVPLETMFAAQFNYWNTSLSRVYSDGRHVHFHISDIEARDSSNLSIVIAQEFKKRNGRYHAAWYFGLFKGKPMSERSGEEIDEYRRILDGIPKRKNRVAGRDLNRLILDTLQALVH